MSKTYEQTETSEQAEVLNRIQRTSEQLRTAAADIRSTLSRVERYLDEGYHVNGLGELQGSGLSFDRLCAEREQMVEIARLLRCNAEQITLASTGADVWFTNREAEAR